MLTAVLICLITCVLMILSIFFFPKVKIGRRRFDVYPAITLAGAAAALLSGAVDVRSVFSALTSDNAVNPLKILVLFFSMALLSIFLDESGFFSILAVAALARAKHSQFALFAYLYLTVSFLTVFTSNDIIILTFTPFICFFAADAGISPLPYLFAEFVAANTWSMALIIGNPTNIYLATACGVGFFEYFVTMILPTVAAGAVSFLCLLLIFRKKLQTPIEPHKIKPQVGDKALLSVGVLHLGLCTVLLAISSYVGFEMWYVALFFAVSLFLSTLVLSAIRKRRPIELLFTLKRAPYPIIPFVLSMFVLILALGESGVTAKICSLLSGNAIVFRFGASSFLLSNVVNNIPMSVLFASVADPLAGSARTGAVFASVVGSNIGAFLTPIGALAGIMWSSILNEHGVRFGFRDFVRYGALIAPPALAAALGVLFLLCPA